MTGPLSEPVRRLGLCRYSFRCLEVSFRLVREVWIYMCLTVGSGTSTSLDMYFLSLTLCYRFVD